jgi:hypothetical protein
MRRNALWEDPHSSSGSEYDLSVGGWVGGWVPGWVAWVWVGEEITLILFLALPSG